MVFDAEMFEVGTCGICREQIDLKDGFLIINGELSCIPCQYPASGGVSMSEQSKIPVIPPGAQTYLNELEDERDDA